MQGVGMLTCTRVINIRIKDLATDKYRLSPTPFLSWSISDKDTSQGEVFKNKVLLSE